MSDLQEEEKIVKFWNFIRKGKLKEVENMFKSGVKINVRERDYPKSGVLHISANSGNLKMLKMLVKKGAKVDMADKDEWTPLVCASDYGHVEMVKYLLEKKANINHQTNSLTSLHRASFNGHLNTVRFLVENGIDVQLKNSEGETAEDLAKGEMKNYFCDLRKVNCDKDNMSPKDFLDLVTTKKKLSIETVNQKRLLQNVKEKLQITQKKVQKDKEELKVYKNKVQMLESKIKNDENINKIKDLMNKNEKLKKEGIEVKKDHKLLIEKLETKYIHNLTEKDRQFLDVSNKMEMWKKKYLEAAEKLREYARKREKEEEGVKEEEKKLENQRKRNLGYEERLKEQKQLRQERIKKKKYREMLEKMKLEEKTANISSYKPEKIDEEEHIKKIAIGRCTLKKNCHKINNDTIYDIDPHDIVRCSSKCPCKLHFHKSCWKTTHRKLKNDEGYVKCPTPDCEGFVQNIVSVTSDSSSEKVLKTPESFRVDLTKKKKKIIPKKKKSKKVRKKEKKLEKSMKRMKLLKQKNKKQREEDEEKERSRLEEEKKREEEENLRIEKEERKLRKKKKRELKKRELKEREKRAKELPLLPKPVYEEPIKITTTHIQSSLSRAFKKNNLPIKSKYDFDPTISNEPSNLKDAPTNIHFSTKKSTKRKKKQKRKKKTSPVTKKISKIKKLNSEVVGKVVYFDNMGGMGFIQQIDRGSDNLIEFKVEKVKNFQDYDIEKNDQVLFDITFNNKKQIEASNITLIGKKKKSDLSQIQFLGPIDSKEKKKTKNLKNSNDNDLDLSHVKENDSEWMMNVFDADSFLGKSRIYSIQEALDQKKRMEEKSSKKQTMGTMKNYLLELSKRKPKKDLWGTISHFNSNNQIGYIKFIDDSCNPNSIQIRFYASEMFSKFDTVKFNIKYTKKRGFEAYSVEKQYFGSSSSLDVDFFEEK